MIIYGVYLSSSIEDWVRLFLFWFTVAALYCFLATDFIKVKMGSLVATIVFWASFIFLAALTSIMMILFLGANYG